MGRRSTKGAVKEAPVWVSGQARRRRRAEALEHAARTRPWRMEYNLAYDGGGSRFDVYYRTAFGARWSAFWHLHFRSWGGSARLYANTPSSAR